MSTSILLEWKNRLNKGNLHIYHYLQIWGNYLSFMDKKKKFFLAECGTSDHICILWLKRTSFFTRTTFLFILIAHKNYNRHRCQKIDGEICNTRILNKILTIRCIHIKSFSRVIFIFLLNNTFINYTCVVLYFPYTCKPFSSLNINIIDFLYKITILAIELYN